MGSPNPSGGSGICSCESWGSAVVHSNPAAPLGLGASPGWLKGHVVISRASCDAGSLPRSSTSSVGVGYALGSLSVAPRSEALRCMRGTMQLWRSHAALHSTLEGTPNFSTQHCRALANTKVSSFWVSLKFLVPWKSQCGRKYLWCRPWILCGVCHQPNTSSWMASSLKATVCFLASCCTRLLVSTLYRGTWILTTS